MVEASEARRPPSDRERSPRRSVTILASAVTSVSASTHLAHAAVADRPGPGGVGGDHPAERGPPAAGRVGRQPQTVWSGRRVEFGQGHRGAGDGPAARRLDLERAVADAGEVHHDALTDVPAAHGAARPAGNQRDALLGRPARPALRGPRYRRAGRPLAAGCGRCPAPSA